jgi:hypothetical protein
VQGHLSLGSIWQIGASLGVNFIFIPGDDNGIVMGRAFYIVIIIRDI